MRRESLDFYDTIPEDMTNYLRYNGRHFNRKLCDFAVSLMTKAGKDGKELKVEPMTKELVDASLTKYKVLLENNTLYDYIFVANMCKADFVGSSIEDEKHFALYIKDVIDDYDSYDGLVFNRWYADMVRKGVPIDWEAML